jgi:hypothetical protein
VGHGKSQRYSSIEHLAKAIWLGKYSRENFMGLLSAAYFDASGKQQGFPFLTVAGAASPIKKWIRFERQWNKVLSDEGVTEFHYTDFAASGGEYKDWKGDKGRRSNFVKRLTKIIKENVNKIFLTTIETQVWNDVNKLYLLEETFHSAYALAGFTVTCQTMLWAAKKKVQIPFKIFFEDGDEGWEGLKELCQKHNKFEPIRLPKKEGVPFQIGDFFAWKTRIAATNSDKKQKQTNDPNLEEAVLKELDSLKKILVCPFRNGIYTRQTLEKTCLNFKIPRRA